MATIKPNHDGGPFHFGFYPGGRFVAENVTLGFVLEAAYGMKDFQVSGGPAWIHSERYNIEAGPPGGPPARHGLRMTGRGQLTANSSGLDRLAGTLSQLLERVVLDQTGLKGRYDFALQWTPDEGQGQLAKGAGDAPESKLPGDASGPSITLSNHPLLRGRQRPW